MHLTLSSWGNSKSSPVNGWTNRQTDRTVSDQACWVLLARSSREAMCEREEVLHSRFGLPLSPSNTVFTSRAHTAKDSWTYTHTITTIKKWGYYRGSPVIAVTMFRPHWPQDCVGLWPLEWAALPLDPPYCHDPESRYLERSRFTNYMPNTVWVYVWHHFISLKKTLMSVSHQPLETSAEGLL